MRGRGVLVAGGIVAALLVGVALWRTGEAPSPAPDAVKVVQAEDGVSPAAASPAAGERMPAAVPPVASTPLASLPMPPELDEVPDSRMLARAVRAEPRDAGWALGAESDLRDQMARLPYMAAAADRLSVRCATTLCEVSGTMPAGVSADNLNVTMQAMQGAPLNDGLTRIGLAQQGITFLGGGKDDVGRFVMWTKRGSR